MTGPAPRGSHVGARAGSVASALLVGILVAGATVYLGLGHAPTPILPTLWSMPDACNSCGVTANQHDVYRLWVDNDTRYGNTNYTLAANNLTTGAPAWPAITVFVRQDFGQYEATIGENAPFLSDSDTVSLVVYGTGEWVTGQTEAVNYSAFSIIVLEWNATTGAFLGVRATLAETYALADVYAIQSDGWLVVAWLVGIAPANISIETFPEASPGSEFSSWMTNISVPDYNWSTWPLLPLTAGPGGVTVTVLQGNGTTFLLSSVGGAVLWEGETPQLYSGEGYLGTVEYYNDVTRIDNSLYYLASNGSSLSVMQFDLASRVFSSVTGSLPVEPSYFASTELETDGAGDLIVTDAWNATYMAFLPSGRELWTDHIFLSTISVPSTGGLASLGFEPVEIPGRGLFTALFQDAAWASGQTGSSFTFTFSCPLQLLNETTGVATWQSSYVASFILGNPGPSTQPVLYLPVLAIGPDLVYLAGQSLGVAQFPATP